MAYQLIYTSVPRGLVPGRSGYTIAARHRQIRDRLVSEIERVSRYSYSKGGDSPEVYAHRIFDISGTKFHVLTRIVDAGSDYTGRTNYLAHHLICDSEELSKSGTHPAEILFSFDWLDSFEGEPKYLEDSDIIELSSYKGNIKLPAANWKSLRGEAADAALLVDTKSKAKNSILTFEASDKSIEKRLILLVGESAKLLSAPNEIAFTTFFQEGDAMSDFQWIGCEAGSSIVQKPTNREIVRLNNISQESPQTDLAQLAVKGVLTPKPSISPNPNNQSTAEEVTPQKNRSTQNEPNIKASTGSFPSRTNVPAPSLTKVGIGASPVSSISRSGLDNTTNDPFYIKNLKLIVISSLVGIVIISGMFFYLTSFQPKQRLQINIDRFASEQKYIEANEYLDKVLNERPNWRERIEGIREEKVFKPLSELTELKINQFVGSSVEKKKVRYDVARNQLDKFKVFTNYFSSGSPEAAKIYELIESYDAAEKRYLDSLRGETAKNNAEEEKVSKPEEISKKDDSDLATNTSKNEPERIKYSPVSLYVFLNPGNFEQLVLPESLRRLSEGAQGQLMVNLKAYGLLNNDFPPSRIIKSEKIKYKFPETAEEENNEMLPISGSINLELKFQGAGSLYLIKRQIKGADSKFNLWGVENSNLISFSEGRSSLDVLLWNGVPFEPLDSHFKYTGGRISLDESLNSVINALARPESEEYSPNKAILKFTPNSPSADKADPLTAVVNLGAGRKEKMFINIEGLSGGGLELLTKIEMQIDERLHLINKGGGEYFKWRKEAIPFEKKLRETAINLLGRNNDVLTRYRRIFDQRDQSRVRTDIRNYFIALIEEFAENLRNDGVKREEVDKIKEDLCESEFPDLWNSLEVSDNDGEVFTEFVDDFVSECQDLSKRRLFGRNKRDFELSYYINSTTARKALMMLSAKIENEFSGSAGESLWDFTFVKRPDAPKNIKQIEKYQAEIESLESKKKEAEIALKNFTPPKLGELPEGKYEIFLVFGDGKPRPFIVTEINNSNQ